MAAGRATSGALTAGLLLLLMAASVSAIDPIDFQNNIDNKNEQTVLAGHIDNLAIIRGNAEFYLINGELALFDFGSGIPCALVFNGNVVFRYAPPDDIERYQLERLYDHSAINDTLDEIAMFFTVAIDDFPDTTSFRRQTVPSKNWRTLEKARDYAFDYFSEYMPNKLLNDFLSDQPGTYLYADIWISRYDHLVFIEDHRFDDIYRLYKPRMAGGVKTYDVLSGYTPGNTLQTQRGLTPVDVTHYDIKSAIDRGGDMTVDCKIHFTPLDTGRRFLYWQWYERNEPIVAFDSDVDSLDIINRENEWGLGVVLNKSLESGRDDFIEIKFNCEAVRNIFGIFVVEGQTFWYPLIMPWDKATYDLQYECLMDYEVISCGVMVDSLVANGIYKSRWVVDIPVKYVSFNIGVFKTKQFELESTPPVVVYEGENYRHDTRTNYYAAVYDNISSANMLEGVGKDVSQSLQFFTEHLGPCPFDTIRVSEIPFGHGQGSPGLLHLSWYTFQFDDLIGTEQRFRAHEVSHQWWGHMVEYENYRDTWTGEGLAEYCGYLYYESIAPDKDRLATIRENWRRDIIQGRDRRVISSDKRFNGIENYIVVVSDGSSAGPMTLGSRLDNSMSYDYQDVVYTKGAYVFHMIRSMMHDYQTNSDEAFYDFLRDMIRQYKNEPVTTENLKLLLEKHLGKDMSWFFNQWVYGIEIPAYDFNYDIKKISNNDYTVSCNVSQDDVPDYFRMPVPVAVYSDNGDTAYFNIMVDRPETEVELPPVNFQPAKVVFNVYDAVLCRVK